LCRLSQVLAQSTSADAGISSARANRTGARAGVGGAALDLRHRDPADAGGLTQVGLSPAALFAGFGDALTEPDKIIDAGGINGRSKGDSRVTSPRAFRSPRLQRTASH
jgi:hypothetical protein